VESPSASDRFLSRRRLLQLSGLSGLGLVLGGCASSLYEDVVFKTFEPLNQSVEELLLNPQKLIPNLPVSAIEPEALLINSFQGTPKIDSQSYLLTVNGDVDRSFTLNLTELQKMPSTSMVIRHVCVEGWAAIVQWGGVPLRDLVALAKPKPDVKYVYFKSADGYYESWDLASSMHPQTLMVYQKNGQPLSPENGAPLRLASPIKLGYKQSKWVTEITLTKQLYPMKGYWEDQGYEWFGGT
jgi:DMSO/TMAO reductase YedYZ molybdopterin-dependent catalytic subunit